jgi:hypothetical protein
MHTLTCWHCGEDFKYTPSHPALMSKPREYFQGYRVCLACVPCMPVCSNPDHETAMVVA